MYPHSLFLGLTLYDIFILVGVVAAFLLADRMTVKRGFSVSLQRIVIICALSAVIVGYGSAVLFQAFYNIAERGKFVIDANTGATFYCGRGDRFPDRAQSRMRRADRRGGRVFARLFYRGKAFLQG